MFEKKSEEWIVLSPGK